MKQPLLAPTTQRLPLNWHSPCYLEGSCREALIRFFLSVELAMFINLWAPIGIVLVIAILFVIFFKKRGRLRDDNTGKPGSAIGR